MLAYGDIDGDGVFTPGSGDETPSGQNMIEINMVVKNNRVANNGLGISMILGAGTASGNVVSSNGTGIQAVDGTFATTKNAVLDNSNLGMFLVGDALTVTTRPVAKMEIKVLVPPIR
jgi:hypothetical protein